MSEAIDAEVVTEGSKSAALIRPAAEPKQVLEALKQFSEFKSKVLRSVENATCDINGKTYLKKEAWVTAKLAFRIRTEVVRESWQRLPDGSASFVCVVRATAPNGDSAEAVGVCDTREDFYRKGTKIGVQEDVPDGVASYRVRDKYGNWNRYLPKPLSAVAGFAQTRAQNRAISTLIGGGENSAEEVTMEDGGEEPRPAPVRREAPAVTPPKPTNAAKPRTPEPGHSKSPYLTGIVLKFGKHKGADLGTVETGYLEWMRDNPLKEDDEKYGATNRQINAKVNEVLEYRIDAEQAGERGDKVAAQREVPVKQESNEQYDARRKDAGLPDHLQPGPCGHGIEEKGCGDPECAGSIF